MDDYIKAHPHWYPLGRSDCAICELQAELAEVKKRHDDLWEMDRKIIGDLRAEVERLKAPWLCDCHTWPGPDEVHKYLVAVEAKLQRAATERELLRRTYDKTVERLERELASEKKACNHWFKEAIQEHNDNIRLVNENAALKVKNENPSSSS